MRPTLPRTFVSAFLAPFLLMATAWAEKPLTLSGYVAARTVDCLNPDCHDHEPIYFLYDEVTGERVRIKGHDKQLKGIHPKQKIRIKGVRRAAAAETAAKKKRGRPTTAGAAGSGSDLEIDQLELLPMQEEAEAEEIAEDGPIAANGANSLEMLSTLLVFISTDTHGCMTVESNARGRLFDNATNANEGMQAITKGRYGLQLGNGTGVPQDHVINLTLNVNSPDHNTSSIETLALDKLFNDTAAEGGLELERLDWNRILLFAPGGITDSGFTAYAYYPWWIYTTEGLVSMYGSSYGNNRMNGYLHELGHNFGFAHSSKGGSEYGDRTCVMGSSNNGTLTQTYNAAKLLEKDWLDVFPNAQLSVTTDTTIDLYPLSSDPNVVDEVIAVDFPGTDYYANYRRDLRPYGYLKDAGDKDKVFVYTRATGSTQKSFQVSRLSEGGSYSGPGTVTFEHYGPNNEFATVSFDMDDGNAKPSKGTTSFAVDYNTATAITLNASDGDGDPLTYTLISNPSSGALSGTIPNLTYTPNTNYVGSDSFVFKVSDADISTYATVSITVNESNIAPIADNQLVNAFLNTPEPITLTATDGNGHSLTYSVVGDPGKGVLSGTAPNLVYTPNTGVSGSDSFTFKVNDGYVDSATATVSITIAASPNTSPNVDAGPNQTVYLQSVATTPGLYYGTTSGDIDISTPNPESQILVDVSSETENSIAGNTTEIYTGSIFDADGQISFTEHIDDKSRIWIDGNLVINNDAWNSRSSTSNLNLSPGWHTIEIRISNGGGGSGPVGGEIGIGYDLNGGTNWQTLVDPGDGSFLRVNQNAVGVAVNLDGTITDSEQTPSANWSFVSGPAAVSFTDASTIDTTANFTQAGTYILRLTADDGYLQTTDDITIIVNPPLPAAYGSWATGGNFSNPFTDIGLDANPDGDNASNLMEFAFGTDPTLSDSTTLSISGDTNGQPTIEPNGNMMELYFNRRKDGSVSYTIQFSEDLSVFSDSSTTPDFVANSTANSDYEVVKVEFPTNAKFARIEVEATP